MKVYWKSLADKKELHTYLFDLNIYTNISKGLMQLHI